MAAARMAIVAAARGMRLAAGRMQAELKRYLNKYSRFGKHIDLAAARVKLWEYLWKYIWVYKY